MNKQNLFFVSIAALIIILAFVIFIKKTTEPPVTVSKIFHALKNIQSSKNLEKPPHFIMEKPNEEITYDNLKNAFDWKNLKEEEKNRQAVIDWLTIYLKYDEQDRADVLESSLLALRSRGVDALKDITAALKTLPSNSEDAKSALIYALGEIGNDISNEDRPGWAEGRIKINEILVAELKKDKEELPTDKAYLENIGHIHGPDMVLEDGKVYQDHSLTKLAAIEALGKIDDDMAKDSLRQIIQENSKDPLIQRTALEILFEISPSDFKKASPDSIKTQLDQE